MDADLPQLKVVPAIITKPRPDHMMLPTERDILVAILQDIPVRTFVEIGVHEGYTAEVLLLNLPGLTHYIGVDVELGYLTSKPSQRMEVPREPGRLVRNDPRFKLITRPRGSLDLQPKDLPICDAVLIDGDHGYEAVCWDSNLAEQITRPGGLIIWHDYYLGEGPLDVRMTLNERAAQGHLIHHISDTWLAFERRP